MTFAVPIKLHAGPARGNYVFLTAVCLSAAIAALMSDIGWPIKLAGISIATGCFVAGWMQLSSQKGCQVIIYSSGAINIELAGAGRHWAELGQGGFRSRQFVTLPLRLAGEKYRYFLVSPANNDNDQYRRLLVWLSYGRAQQ